MRNQSCDGGLEAATATNNFSLLLKSHYQLVNKDLWHIFLLQSYIAGLMVFYKTMLS